MSEPTTTLLVMENARMRLHTLRPVLHPDDTKVLRELLFRLAGAPQEGTLYTVADGITHLWRHIDVTAGELVVLNAAANGLRADAAVTPRNIGELRVWDVLIDAIADCKAQLGGAL